MRERLRTSRFLRALRSLPYGVPYWLLSRMTRVRPQRFLFLSDSHSDFTGNFAFLRDELLRQRPDAEVIGIFKSSLRARRRVRDMIRLPILMATSGTIVLDDFYPLIYPLQIRPSARLIQVWHAVGAFKQVGHSRAGLPGGPVPGTNIHRNYTDAPVSSERIRGDYAEAFGIDVSRVRALGVPRTDVFFDPAYLADARARVRERLGIAQGERLVLFAPTFRGNGQLTARTDETADWGRIASDLGDGYRVVVRRHPFTERTAPPLPDGVLNGAFGDMNDLLTAADVLVTDYSSSIFEFALLRRPIVLFVPDLDAYAGSRSFYRPFETYATGPVIREARELASAIRAARVDDTRMDAFLTEFCGALDGHSSERIVRELFLTPRDTDPSRAGVADQTVAPGGSAPAPTRADSAMGFRLFVAAVARGLLTVLYAPLKLLPLRRKVVLISREHPTTPDDFRDLARAIERRDSSVRVVTLVRMVPPGFFAKIGYAFHMLRQLYHVATARALLVDTYAIVASVLRHRDSLTVVQLWHALGAFKKFGLSILGQEEGRDARLASAMRMHQGYDIVLTSSEHCRRAYAEAFGTDLSRVTVAPLPRVDRLRDPARREATRERIYERHPHLRGRRVAVFAPTFRLDGTVTVDAATLSRALASLGIHTVVKLHPLMRGHFGSGVDVADGFSTQEMLTVADVFITDYSSTLYESAVLGVPSYFLAPDLDEYLSSRDFYLDYRHDLPGPILRTVEDLVTAISGDAATTAEALAFAHRWVQVPGNAEPTAGATPCADAIADLVVDAVDSVKPVRIR